MMLAIQARPRNVADTWLYQCLAQQHRGAWEKSERKKEKKKKERLVAFYKKTQTQKKGAKERCLLGQNATREF